MSTSLAHYYAPVTSTVVSDSPYLPSSLATTLYDVGEAQDAELRVEIPGLGLVFGTGLSDMHLSDDYSVVTLESLLDPGLTMLVTLKTQVADDAGNLQIREVSINFDVTEHTPRAHFLAASMYAMLPLAGPIRVVIPMMRVDVTANFSTPLREISNLLQKRQTYYGLMVIERAAGVRLDIPEHISTEDMNSIAFTYHAIVEREFDWLATSVMTPAPANEEILAWLDNLKPIEPGGSVYKLQFGPTPELRTVLGQTVSLGPETIFIEDAIILNREELRRELSNLDGRIVPIMIKSLSGLGRYHLPEAPRLPDSPWDEKIESCIMLEDRLNESLAATYNELAASTLEGLTPEEVTVVTERAILDEDAHLIRD